MKQILCVILLVAFSLCSCCFAEINPIQNSISIPLKDTKPIPLTGGQIPPRGNINISLDELIIDAHYVIKCDIENPNYQKTYPIILRIYANTCSTCGGVGDFSINGKPPNLGQAALNQYSNKFAASASKHDPGGRLGLGFSSYDDTDTAFVKNCFAYLVS